MVSLVVRAQRHDTDEAETPEFRQVDGIGKGDGHHRALRVLFRFGWSQALREHPAPQLGGNSAFLTNLYIETLVTPGRIIATDQNLYIIFGH